MRKEWERKIRLTVLIPLVFFILGSSAVFAARPLMTDDTGTVKKGTFELELAFDFLRDEGHNNNYLPSAHLLYGFLERAEVAVLLGYIQRDMPFSGKVDGWTDLIFNIKYRLWEEGKYFPSMAFKPLVKFPTASQEKGLGSGKMDYGLGPVFTKSYEDFRFHLDAVYLFTGEKGQSDTLNAGAAMEYEFLKSWVAVGEVRYSNNFNSDSHDDPLLVNFGLKKGIGRAIFDAAFNVGLNRAAPDYGFTVGVTIDF